MTCPYAFPMLWVDLICLLFTMCGLRNFFLAPMVFVILGRVCQTCAIPVDLSVSATGWFALVIPSAFPFFSVTSSDPSNPLPSRLICHDESQRDFVVCAPNSAFAHRFSCADGMFFNQKTGKCVKRRDESDCVVKTPAGRWDCFCGATKRRKTLVRF